VEGHELIGNNCVDITCDEGHELSLLVGSTCVDIICSFGEKLALAIIGKWHGFKLDGMPGMPFYSEWHAIMAGGMPT
jgi:hypothetical protein